MKKLLVIMCVALAVSSTLAESLKLGFINSDRIIREYSMVEDAKKELQNFSATKEREATEMEREIQEMQQQLKEQQLMLSEERQQEMLQEIQQKTTEYQRFLQETFGQSGLIAQKNQELMEPIMNEIDRAVNELSEEEGFDFIFDNAVGLIYGKPAFDITEQILSKLDAE